MMSTTTSNPGDLLTLSIYTRYVEGVDFEVDSKGRYSKAPASYVLRYLISPYPVLICSAERRVNTLFRALSSTPQSVRPLVMTALTQLEAANSIIEASQLWIQPERCRLGPEGVAR
jgi:hypothetical protein